MAENKQPEIPQEIRELAVQNIGQAHAACNQLMDAANKAQEMMKAMIPSNPMAAGITEAQERAMRFTTSKISMPLSHWPTSLPRQRTCKRRCKSKAGTRNCRCTPMRFRRRSLAPW